MKAVADTVQLVEDEVITVAQAAQIEARSRALMFELAVASVLMLGILAATGGLIVWLADPVSVAVCGLFALLLGIVVLTRAARLYRMFGHASALIGAGLLLGGAAIELIEKHWDVAGWVMTGLGLAVGLAAARAFSALGPSARILWGAGLLMGLAMHLTGLGIVLYQASVSGPGKSLFYLYATTAIVAAGWLIDVRLVTALAIVPFAQALDTGTAYFHAAYVFYSAEPTLSILQMSLLVAVGLHIARRGDDRTARHAMILAVMAFIVANLCALVGSLFGDVVGETVWGPDAYDWNPELDWEDQQAEQEAHRADVEAFRDSALVIPEGVYSAVWAVVLAGLLFWAAHRNLRGLFNATMTFGAIHAYTQLFETYGDEPVAWVVGGLAAIPLAWGMWRLNRWIADRGGDAGPP